MAGHFKGFDLISGTNGDDRIDGTDGDERIAGLDGDDLLQGLGGDDQLYGGLGDDTLLGGSGNDTLYGGGGHDQVQGGSGDDLIIANQVGVDSIDGGSGYDILDMSGAKAGVIIQLLGGAAFPVVGVEEAIGSAFGDSLVGGFGGGYVLRGMDGDDDLSFVGDEGAAPNLLLGGRGDDALHGSYSTARMVGGAGDDYIMSIFKDDTLTGGKGSDQFELRHDAGYPTDGVRITDLSNRDTISIRYLDGGGWTVVGGFDGHAHQAVLSYDAGSDTTSLQFDSDGDQAADLTVLIDGDHADFHHFIL